MASENSPVNEDLIEELEQATRHQTRWRRIMSAAYFSTAGIAIFSSGFATVVAGQGDSKRAAMFAGLATVLFGLEKGLLFREKWAHHLSISAQLEALRLEYAYGTAIEEDVATEMGAILTDYARRLPINPTQTGQAPREQPADDQ